MLLNQDMSSTFENIQDVLSEILDVDAANISENTYIIRELGAESIDLMEVAASLSSKFDVRVTDNKIFLRNLRTFIIEAQEKGIDVKQYLTKQYPYLSEKRIQEIVFDIDNGPVLKVSDLIYYIEGVMNE